MDEQKNNEKLYNKNISGYNRWGIIITSGLMAIILIISWILWLTFFRTNIDEILTMIDDVIFERGINFTLNFQTLTITILVFAGTTLVIATTPFIFLKKKGLIIFLLALAILLVSIVLIVLSALFGYFGHDAFLEYVNSKTIVDILFFALPWALEMVCCLILFGFCICLIVSLFLNKKSKIKTTIITQPTLTAENTQKSPFDTVNSKLNEEKLSPFTEDISVPLMLEEQHENVNLAPPQEQKQSHQGINIVITNNTGPTPSIPTPTLSNRDNNVISNQPAVLKPMKPITTTSEIVPNPEPSINIKPTTSEIISNPNSSEILWTPQQIDEVWNKGKIIPNFNPQLYRQDYAGALMFKNSFLNNVKLNDDPKSYNWTIIYQRPLLHGGTNDISNMQPINNTNAIAKANNYPRWKTTISFDGKQNYLKQKSWKDKK